MPPVPGGLGLRLKPVTGAPPTTDSTPHSPNGTPVAPDSGGESGLPSSPTSGGTGLAVPEWTVWWRYNRELFVGFEREDHQPISGPDRIARGISREIIETDIVPELAAQLAADEDRNVVNAALIAMGLANAPLAADLHADDAVRQLRPFLEHPSRWVAENASLGLGLSANPSSVRELALLARGENVSSEHRTTDRGRAFAVYAMALTALRSRNQDVQRFVVDELVRLAKPAKGEPHVEVGCALSLAVLAETNAELARLCGRSSARFVQWLHDETLDPRFRAHVPRLLAAIAGHDTPLFRDDIARELLAALDRKERHEVESGLVQALGPMEIENRVLARKVSERLIRTAEKGGALARRLAWIALGQRAARPEGEAAGKRLLQAAARSKARFEAWVALGLGVWADEELRAGETPEVQRQVARAALAKTKSKEIAAAWALCAGLTRDTDTIAEIARHAEDEGTVALLSVYASALGLIGTRATWDPLHAIAERMEHKGEVVETVAIGLLSAGDPAVSTDLLRRLRGACCATSASAQARALARIQDPGVIAPLLAFLEDKDRGSSSRAWAVHALGRLSDRMRIPWAASFTAGLNYGALTSTLSSSDASGLLDQG